MFAQRGQSANYYAVHPGNTPCKPPPYRSVHDPFKTASIQDPGTRGYRGWKAAAFLHSARTAHGAPPQGLCDTGTEKASRKRDSGTRMWHLPGCGNRFHLGASLAYSGREWQGVSGRDVLQRVCTTGHGAAGSGTECQGKAEIAGSVAKPENVLRCDRHVTERSNVSDE